LTSTSLS